MNTQHPGSQQTNPYPAGQYYPPAGWQPKLPASGLRIATGVVALVMSVFGIFTACMFLFTRHSGASSPFNGWMNFFLIVGSIGCLVTGIVILAKQRKRGGATPWLVASFGALGAIACLGFMAGGNSGLPGAFDIILPVALATVILALLVTVLVKPKR
ncbi:hypothetical protein GCM10009712_20450 [Pseudarthrobacter sulfonivorans]|uniref:hypothetical protein n=1 Tax=Pseudarthrobacter sulfonivorans TaxID=121292 RepID=UPI00168A6269|nr:hypothetical protein [Pseudarthrobacter sulfonivorans]